MDSFETGEDQMAKLASRSGMLALARSRWLYQAHREQLLSGGNDQVTAPRIGVVPVFLNLTEGSREEMRNS